MAVACRQQQQPRRPDCVRGDNHDLGRLEMLVACLSIHVAPVARPSAFVSMRRTRAPVTSRAPLAIALGQWVRSVEALAPSLQPDWQVDLWTHGRRPSYGAELIELNSGHQCQPSLVCARATLRPAAPIGSGGIGASSVSWGYAGRRAARRCRSRGRCGRSRAGARSSRSASRRRRRRASARGSRTGGRAAMRRRR